ncbi:MAG: hypothetical protein JW723_15750 [Bacteroidales bacterium]|nr:hypothetical protein [Bacteroidales bacterium]
MNYKLNSGYSYCVDMFDIKLINMKARKQITLRYPDAAVYALMLKGYAYTDMVRMMAEIALVTKSHAEKLVNDTMNMLQEYNVIEKQ